MSSGLCINLNLGKRIFLKHSIACVCVCVCVCVWSSLFNQTYTYVVILNGFNMILFLYVSRCCIVSLVHNKQKSERKKQAYDFDVSFPSDLQNTHKRKTRANLWCYIQNRVEVDDIAVLMSWERRPALEGSWSVQMGQEDLSNYSYVNRSAAVVAARSLMDEGVVLGQRSIWHVIPLFVKHQNAPCIRLVWYDRYHERLFESLCLVGINLLNHQIPSWERLENPWIISHGFHRRSKIWSRTFRNIHPLAQPARRSFETYQESSWRKAKWCRRYWHDSLVKWKVEKNVKQ